MTDFNQKTHDTDVAKALGYVNPYAAVKRHCRGPLTKREGIVHSKLPSAIEDGRPADGDGGRQRI